MKQRIFILAPDSFKGSMTARQVCDAMERGIKNVFPNAKCIKVPMADGGEGTVQSLVDATKGKIYEMEVTGPLGIPVIGRYGILGDGETAVVEMASAGGIHLVNENTCNPLITTTFGVGELVLACLDKGITKIIMGIGGSATNDGGAGFAQALGMRFLNSEGAELPFGGLALKDLQRIDISNIDKRLQFTDIEVACDVTNPLCGKDGASFIFAPQKGATPTMVELLENALWHYADIIKLQLGKDVKDIPGAGAAGGLGAGLLAFTNAHLEKGVEIIINYAGLQDIIKDADFVFTGEGKIDSQTQYGKTPYGVAQAAKAENKTVVAVAGYIEEGMSDLYVHCFDFILSIMNDGMSVEESMRNGEENIEKRVMQFLVDNKSIFC